MDEETFEQPALLLPPIDPIPVLNYSRPALEASQAPIFCMVTDIDHTLSPDQHPLLRIFCLTAEAQSLLVLVHNFYPYLYVEMPAYFDTSAACMESLKASL